MVKVFLDEAIFCWYIFPIWKFNYRKKYLKIDCKSIHFKTFIIRAMKCDHSAVIWWTQIVIEWFIKFKANPNGPVTFLAFT